MLSCEICASHTPVATRHSERLRHNTIKPLLAKLAKQEEQIRMNAAEIAEQYLEVRYWEQKNRDILLQQA